MHRQTDEPSAPSILIIDDEELYLRALSEDLQRRGHDVRRARDLDSGEAAYRELRQSGRRFRVVLDLILPGEDGGWLGGLDLLRRLTPGPEQEIVALCDSEADWLSATAVSLGATRVLRKPDLRRTDPEHLDHAVHDFLAQLAGEREAPDDRPGGERTGVSEALLGALEELRGARDRETVLLLVMRMASEVAARGLLYQLQGDALQALGSFGLGESTPDVRIPLDRDTLPGRAFWSARLQRATGANLPLLSPPLPEPQAAEAAALPVLGPEGVVAVIYADCTGRDHLADLRPLSTLAGTASLALHRLSAV